MWSLIHDYVLDMGNPFFEDDDPSTKDEAIYAGILDWKSNWKLILSYSGLIVFVFGPILYIYFFGLFRYTPYVPAASMNEYVYDI